MQLSRILLIKEDRSARNPSLFGDKGQEIIADLARIYGGVKILAQAHKAFCLLAENLLLAGALRQEAGEKGNDIEERKSNQILRFPELRQGPILQKKHEITDNRNGGNDETPSEIPSQGSDKKSKEEDEIEVQISGEINHGRDQEAIEDNDGEFQAPLLEFLVGDEGKQEIGKEKEG
jgi:hypothetical protein